MQDEEQKEPEPIEVQEPEAASAPSHQLSESAQAAELASAAQPDIESLEKTSKLERFKLWYKSKKKLSVPLTILVVILILAAVPATRFGLAGLALKRDISITVKDSDTRTPVSGAAVSYGNQSVITDANGRATLYNIKPGPANLSITKKYYKDQSSKFSIPILKSQTAGGVLIQATGRQVEIKVIDYVNGSPLAGVNIKLADTTAKTKTDGSAIVVVPAGQKTQKATLSAEGFNNKDADIAVSNEKIQQNTVRLTPAGKIYFFSKRTGNLDLMKSDIDGSNVATVLPASGYEQTYATSIYQSPDWKYVGIVTKRAASDDTPQLYIISANDDRLLSVDSGKANFSINGWDGDTMIYTATRTDLPSWQSGQSKIKAYDANSGKMTLLDQTQGSDLATNINEVYNNTIVSAGSVTFSKYWGGDSTKLSGKQNTVQQIDSTGQNHRTVASYDAAATSLQIALHNPTTFYISVNTSTPPYTTTYYSFSGSGTPKQVNIDPSSFYPSTLNYYPSPSGKQLLWSELRDGKNAILVGDQNGGSPNVIGSYAEFTPYGWFSDKYVILSKNSNELYIVSATGGDPQKITDYQSTNYYY